MRTQSLSFHFVFVLLFAAPRTHRTAQLQSNRNDKHTECSALILFKLSARDRSLQLQLQHRSARTTNSVCLDRDLSLRELDRGRRLSACEILLIEMRIAIMCVGGNNTRRNNVCRCALHAVFVMICTTSSSSHSCTIPTLCG